MSCDVRYARLRTRRHGDAARQAISVGCQPEDDGIIGRRCFEAVHVGVRGSPERDILSLGTLGDGGWPGWGVLPPAPSRPWPGLARPGHFEK